MFGNVTLQAAISKYGIENFEFVVYEFTPYTLPDILNMESTYISSVPASMLYNIKMSGTSMWGYKHTPEAIAKMVDRFTDKSNHPMFGKHHGPDTLARISKPGPLNPMYGVSHTQATRDLISAKLSRQVFFYDVDHSLVLQFSSNTLAAAHFGVFKGTIGRYIVSGKLFKGKYYIYSKQI